MTVSRSIMLIPVVALAGACMAPPAPPAAVASALMQGAFAATPTASLDPVPNDWWRLFDDVVLDRLVRASLSANTDLRVAFANLDASRAALRQANAARLPQTTIESGVGIDDPSNQPSSASVPATDYDVAATASWDIDLFGRLRSNALAARADADAQAAVLDGLRVAIAADTVLAYVDLCGAGLGANVSRAILAAQEENLRVVEDQYRAGELSPLEVSQAAGLVEAARASLEPFEAARTNALYRLATLQGLPPVSARQWQLECAALPKLGAAAPVGDGAALLLRRPDIREAERRLAAATARIGVARADLYPRINLGGALGLLAGSFTATASPLISWSFPNQAPVRARIAQAQATEQAALANWDVVVLRALREVETALSAYDAETRRAAALVTATHQAELYARRASARVRIGDAAPLLQIDAERTRATAALQQAQSELAVAQAQVALFKALGGGWQDAPMPLAQGPGAR